MNSTKKTVIGFIGEPNAIECNLKPNFISRFHGSDEIIIILDKTGKSKDFVNRCGDGGAKYVFDDTPSEFPRTEYEADKRIIVLHGEMYTDEDQLRKAVDYALQQMQKWTFPEGKAVTVYAINDTALYLDIYNLMQASFNGNIFWTVQHYSDFNGCTAMDFDQFSDTLLCYGLNSFITDKDKECLTRNLAYKCTIESGGDFCLLKNDTPFNWGN